MTLSTVSKKNPFLAWLEEAEAARLKRTFTGRWQIAYGVMAATYSLALLYSAIDATISSAVFRGGFLMAITAMVFLRHPARAAAPMDRPSWLDLVLVALSVLAFGNFIIDYDNMAWRAGAVTERDIVFGVIAITLVLEACRRAMSLLLPLIALGMALYAYFGAYIPGELFGHQGFELSQIIGEVYASMNGIFGFVTYVFIAYVMLFVVMGAMFETFGAGTFFIGLPVALMARSRGGAAKAAVVSSALFGTISGSATANVVATGTFTIPLMKRTGYKPHVAAGIESAASTGGMFMPPVMGAGAFLMAELMQVPYAEVVKAAAVPALLYFAAILMMVHFEALATGIQPIPEQERQRPLDVFRQGWFFLIPLAVLFGALFTGRTASLAAFCAIAAFLAVMFVNMALQGRIPDFFELLYRALVEGGEKSLMVGSTAGPVGIIVCLVLLIGLGFKFSALLLGFTYGHLWLAVILVIIGTLVLGLGMTVTADYLILAVLAVPALGELGVPLMAAHMCVFWLSQSSNVTPPVCMAAFAGAGIANTNPYRAGLQAMRFSAYLYLMPFMFVYTPVLMPDGFNLEVLHTWLGLALALVPFAAAVSGYLVWRLSMPARLVLIVSAIGLSLPDWRATLLGLVLFFAVATLNQRKRRAVLQ